jgi:ferredoxin-NADP reductase
VSLRVVAGGSVSPSLASLSVGSIVFAKGPTGRFKWNNEYRRILMIGGGSGVTPFLQIARRIERDEARSPSMRLVLCNSRADDVIEAEAVSELEGQGVWEVAHVISEKRGRIAEADLEPAQQDTLAMICGPIHFVSHVKALLEARGFNPGQVFVC